MAGNVQDSPEVLQLEALEARAQAGDQKAAAELRRVLDQNPQIWRAVGDLSSHVERAYTELIAGPNPLVAESLRRQTEALRKSLLGGGTSVAEKLLVDEVVGCWLALKHSELKAAADPVDPEVNVARFHLKRMERTRSQFDRALRSLETFRRLQAGDKPPQKSSSPTAGSDSGRTAPTAKKAPTKSAPRADKTRGAEGESGANRSTPPPTIPIDGNISGSAEASAKNEGT